MENINHFGWHLPWTKPPKDPWKLQPPIQQPPIQQATNRGFPWLGMLVSHRVSGLMLPCPRCWLRRGRKGQNGCSDFFQGIGAEKTFRDRWLLFILFLLSNLFFQTSGCLQFLSKYNRILKGGVVIPLIFPNVP